MIKTPLVHRVLLLVVIAFGITATAAAQNTLVIAQAGDIATIDNQQSVGPAKNALLQIYDWQWIRFGVDELEDGRLVSNRDLVPAIIEAWETVQHADGTATHRFHIRPGAVHHSGNPIIADDFVYTLKRRAAFGRDYIHRFFGGIYGIDEFDERVRAIDDLTFEVDVRRVMPLFWDIWAQRTYYDSVLMLENATDDDPWSEAFAQRGDAGSGPYTITRWETGVEMVLDRFDDYWGDRPAFDRLVFRTVPDLSSRILLLRTGAVDVALDIPLQELEQLRNDPNITVISAPSIEQLFIGFNLDMPPFDNKDLRLALSYAFPYTEVIEQAYLDQATPSYGPIPNLLEGALSERRFAENMDLAREHLERSGLGSGLQLTLRYSTAFPQHETIGILFRENLRQLGIELNLQRLPVGEFETGIRTTSHDFFVRQSLAWVTTPEYVNLLNFDSDSSANPTGYANEAADEIIRAALIETDDGARHALNVQAQELIIEDVPWIFIAHPNGQIAMRSNLTGYVMQNTQLHHFWLMGRE